MTTHRVPAGASAPPDVSPSGPPAPLAPASSSLPKWIAADGTRHDDMSWNDLMLSGALRARAEWLRERLDAPPDERMIRRIVVDLAVRRVQTSSANVERAERSIHTMLDCPSKFTIKDLLVARAARVAAIQDLHEQCDVVRHAVDAFVSDERAMFTWYEGYVRGAVKER